MSRGVKAIVGVSLLVTAAGALGWAWFLAEGDLTRASGWSGVLQGFAALLAVPGLVVAVLALRAPAEGAADHRPGGGVVQSSTVRGIKAGGNVTVDVDQSHAPAPGGTQGPTGPDPAP